MFLQTNAKALFGLVFFFFFWRRQAILQRHMPNKTPWLAPGCRRHAFASLRSKAPVPTFYKCPIWHEMSLAVSLKVLVQIPPSNVNPFQVLNDPNDAFQIVSSRITFRGNGGLCFINPTGNRWRKNWKVICTASFYFIVKHYCEFCLLISESLSLASKKKR